MSKRFLLNYYDSPTCERNANVIVEAETMSEAYQMAYKRPEAKYYDNLMVSELTYLENTNGKLIVQLEYEVNISYPNDCSSRQREFAYFICNNEANAISYYNHNYYNKTVLKEGTNETIIKYGRIKNCSIQTASWDWLKKFGLQEI